MLNVELIVLRAKIKGLVLESQKIRKRINKLHTEDPDKRAEIGLERSCAWNDKRLIGSYAREALLAYAFMRGVPYKNVEQKTNNPPNPIMIEKALRGNLGTPDLDKIKQWLAGADSALALKKAS